MVKPINSEDTRPIRQRVLRPGHPPEACFFENDLAEDTLHLGAFDEEKILGIVSFMKEKNPSFEGNQYRMRGMAVVPEYQGKGYGKRLVIAGQEHMKALGVDTIWFNAREIAVDFYKKLGFKTQGAAFDIPSVGPHYVMYKVFSEHK